MINGFLNVYKEQGWTSLDVVAKLRSILKQKKIGHTGTLDPMAEGVLLVCLGNATKLCELLTKKDKTYRCTMLLGRTSDTEDVTGTVTQVTDVYPTESAIREMLMSFVGTYMQIPPMYSAIKVNGKRLYELARQGETVEREPRAVTIYDINIESVNIPEVTFTVHCSKGTYIRSLCRDAGKKLGCGAVMERLVRTEVRGFSVSDSLRLSEIDALATAEELSAHIISTDRMLSDLPKLRITANSAKLLANGNKLSPDCFIVNRVYEGTYVKVYDVSGRLAALYMYDEGRGQYVPYKMLPDNP